MGCRLPGTAHASQFPQIATVEAGARPAPAPPPLLTGSRAREYQLARGLATASVIILPLEAVPGRRRCKADVSDAHACSQHTQPALTPVLKWRDPTSRDDADTAHEVWVALAWGFYVALSAVVIHFHRPVNDREVERELQRLLARR
jgi:hypothetical protein